MEDWWQLCVTYVTAEPTTQLRSLWYAGGMAEITPKVHVYEDDFPKHLGPPPVPNYTGAKLHEARTPTYLVQLDAGAFMALWEHMEAEARHKFPTHGTFAHVRAYLRVVEALRKTYWAHHEAPDPPEEKQPRKLVRKPRR